MALKRRTTKLKSKIKIKIKKKVPITKRKKILSSLKWTSAKISLYERGQLRAKSWVSISTNGMVYISRSPGTRTYWILSRIAEKSWPKFKWSDRNLSFSVNATRIVFKKSVDYVKAKNNFMSITPPNK